MPATHHLATPHFREYSVKTGTNHETTICTGSIAPYPLNRQFTGSYTPLPPKTQTEIAHLMKSALTTNATHTPPFVSSKKKNAHPPTRVPSVCGDVSRRSPEGPSWSALYASVK